jgi:anti-sigma regulatory factor (Ser/Thr protein kinase)
MTGRTSTHSPPRSGGGACSGRGGTGTVSGAAAPVLTRGPRQSRAPVPVPPTADGGTSMERHWPMRDYLELGALPGAVPSARLHVRHILWEWALTPLTKTVELVVSELVTNAVAATTAMRHAEAVRLWLLSDTRKVLLLVWDASPHLPVLTEADEYADSGRGIFLVQAFSERWGSYRTPDMGGKIVWALCG